jgi:hypothetical protein
MDNDMNNINKMKTWILFYLPSRKKIITCKWIYKMKPRMMESMVVHIGLKQDSWLEVANKYKELIILKPML